MKTQKVFSKPWKPLPKRVPKTPKQQPLQQVPGESLEKKAKILIEVQLILGTIDIEEKIKLSQDRANFIRKNWKKTI